jgi:hypothetical protein
MVDVVKMNNYINIYKCHTNNLLGMNDELNLKHNEMIKLNE